MPATATLTGQTGPAVVFTSIAATNVTFLSLDFNASVGYIKWIAANGQTRTLDFDLVKTTTLTDTIAALLHTIVIAGS